MRKKVRLKRYIIVSFCIFIIATGISIIVHSIFIIVCGENYNLDYFIGMVDGIISAIATGLVLYQLKVTENTEIHQSDIEEASFILRYNQAFIQDKNMIEVERLLENQIYYSPEEIDIISENNRQQFINYLVYLEGMAPLILHGVLSLENIDNLMAYRFFLAMDNKELQEVELKPYAEYYRGCFKLYKKWKEYRERKNLKNPCDDCKNKYAMIPIDTWKYFEYYASENN